MSPKPLPSLLVLKKVCLTSSKTNGSAKKKRDPAKRFSQPRVFLNDKGEAVTTDSLQLFNYENPSKGAHDTIYSAISTLTMDVLAKCGQLDTSSHEGSALQEFDDATEELDKLVALTDPDVRPALLQKYTPVIEEIKTLRSL